MQAFCYSKVGKLAHCGFNLSESEKKSVRAFSKSLDDRKTLFIVVTVAMLYHCIWAVVNRKSRQWRHSDTNHSKLSVSIFQLNNEIFSIVIIMLLFSFMHWLVTFYIAFEFWCHVYMWEYAHIYSPVSDDVYRMHWQEKKEVVLSNWFDCLRCHLQNCWTNWNRMQSKNNMKMSNDCQLTEPDVSP